jgi:LemA protein
MGLALLAGVMVVAGFVVVTFNRLVRLRQLADGAWADIDVQLKRRHDLIPAVVAAVQGHAGYERGTLEAVVEARARAREAGGPAERGRVEQEVEGALHRIFAVAEAYPDLQAAASFRALQESLTLVEDHLQAARRYYNAVVRDLNTAIAQFPASLVAGPARFTPREFFALDDPAERVAPRLDLGSRS